MSQYIKFHLGEKLTLEQKSFFEQFGFIHFKNFIGEDAIQELINASLEIQQDWIDRDKQKVNGIPVKYGKDLDGRPIVQRFAFVNHHHGVFGSLISDERFRVLLELIGEGARIGWDEKDGMVFNHYVNGPESKFKKMGWHVDGLRDLFLDGKLNPMLNVGIHLNTVSPRHGGGLRILPGSHKQSLYHLFFRKRHFFDHSPDLKEIAIDAEPGDLTVHDGRLWHRVAQSQIVGEESRRRVIYFPIVAGKYTPKHENSPTPFYQRFAGLIG